MTAQLSTVPVRAAEPLVPESLAVGHILVASEPSAREWFRVEDDPQADHSAPRPVLWLAELEGVDEADVVALHIAVTNQDAVAASHLITRFVEGHHGLLEHVPREMVNALSDATVTPELLTRVNALAATLRGEPKPAVDAQLTTDALTTIVTAYRESRQQPVFLNLME